MSCFIIHLKVEEKNSGNLPFNNKYGFAEFSAKYVAEYWLQLYNVKQAPYLIVVLLVEIYIGGRHLTKGCIFPYQRQLFYGMDF